MLMDDEVDESSKFIKHILKIKDYKDHIIFSKNCREPVYPPMRVIMQQRLMLTS